MQLDKDGPWKWWTENKDNLFQAFGKNAQISSRQIVAFKLKLNLYMFPL